MGQTDGRTPDRYLDHALHTVQAVSARNAVVAAATLLLQPSFLG